MIRTLILDYLLSESHLLINNINEDFTLLLGSQQPVSFFYSNLFDNVNVNKLKIFILYEESEGFWLNIKNVQ
jgi:hypothetical protein